MAKEPTKTHTNPNQHARVVRKAPVMPRSPRPAVRGRGRGTRQDANQDRGVNQK
jgi:hypothetical protein